MHKLSVNISDVAWEQLKEITEILSKEDQPILIAKYTISDTVNMIIDRAYNASKIWKETKETNL